VVDVKNKGGSEPLVLIRRCGTWVLLKIEPNLIHIFLFKMIGLSKNIDGTELKVFNNGTIKRKMTHDWKEIKNTANQSKGYNVILINKKQYMRSKIIVNAFLKIPLDDKSIYICHKDNDKLNCSFKNLEIKKKMV
jgi:hypothetical protein